jgi:nucleotidyltransferase/DNA polymerase involved in DNA repair
MSETVFSLRSWPRAILHVDGDAFFTSCEEAVHPQYRGKPLISWPRAILHVDGDAFFTSCEEAVHPEMKGKPLITGASAVSLSTRRNGSVRG